MSRKLQLKRGVKAALPLLADGEPALVTDEKKLYIGTNNGNKAISMDGHTHAPAESGADPAGSAAAVDRKLAQHAENRSNPHGVTVDQIDAVPSGRTVNNKSLSGNITLYASDIGAAASAHTHNPPEVGIGYGVCATMGSAMVADVPGFRLATGAIAIVKFAYAVPANTTLNINGTGAKPIRWCGKAMGDSGILAEDICELIYTGNSWDLLAIDRIAATGGINSVSFAADSWETIQKVCAKGKHKSCYSVGDKKSVTLTTGESITIRIEDFDHDTLSAGGKAPLSLMMENCLKDRREMNGSNTNVGGWGSSEMRTWISSTLLWQLPSDLQAAIKEVNKLTSARNFSSAIVTTSDKLWLPSYTEVNFPHNASYSPGGEGSRYPLFISDASRIKMSNGSAYFWWLRSPFANNTTGFDSVMNSSGSYYADGAINAFAVAVGFCI